MKRRDKAAMRQGRDASRRDANHQVVSQRQLKMGEQIRHILSEAALREGLSGPTGTP